MNTDEQLQNTRSEQEQKQKKKNKQRSIHSVPNN